MSVNELIDSEQWLSILIPRSSTVGRVAHTVVRLITRD